MTPGGGLGCRAEPPRPSLCSVDILREGVRVDTRVCRPQLLHVGVGLRRPSGHVLAGAPGALPRAGLGPGAFGNEAGSGGEARVNYGAVNR